MGLEGVGGTGILVEVGEGEAEKERGAGREEGRSYWERGLGEACVSGAQSGKARKEVQDASELVRLGEGCKPGGDQYLKQARVLRERTVKRLAPCFGSDCHLVSTNLRARKDQLGTSGELEEELT